MIQRALSATPFGVSARLVEIEVEIRLEGTIHFTIVGLPDTAVRESRDRVRAAVRQSGFKLEARPVVVNLAPADLRKEGNHLDLAIALALLAAYGKIDGSALEGRLFCGELGLDGRLRPVRGALSISELAVRENLGELVLPRANARLAACVEGSRAIGVSSLEQAIAHILGKHPIEASSEESRSSSHKRLPDLKEVNGQETAKRALEVAAAGGHNLLFIGPPGTGKTMLARRMPSLLPALNRDESIQVTKIHTLVDASPRSGLILERPFRSPHASTSTAGLIGGGSLPQPGEVSLAHAGVLFLDELPEFRRDSLEALRQPLEDGTVTVARARARLRFPARFSLLAAMNPCPCGYLGDPRNECHCPPNLILRYRQRISGPLLDRIDLHVEVPAPSYEQMRGPGRRTNLSSVQVAERVAASRERQRFRFPGGHPTPFNAALERPYLERHVDLESSGETLLQEAYRRLRLSARSLDRILRVARTVADLDNAARVGDQHLAEALQYRGLAIESKE